MAINRSVGRKAGAILATAALTLSLAACSSGEENKNEDGTGGALTIFTQTSTYEGKLDGYVGKNFKDKLGLEINVVPSTVGGTDRFQTRLTTGDLGDLVIFGSRDALQQAINANLMLDLNEHKEELPNMFRFADGVARMESLDDGKLYGMPSGVAENADISRGDWPFIPSIRYDYYKELGSPVIQDYWGYQDVTIAMAQAHPTTEAGDKFYALSLFGGWDGTSAGQIRNIAQAQGWATGDGTNNYDLINIDPKNKVVEDLLQDGSIYLQGLKWANGFHRAGQLDPDSATQTWDDYLKKGEKGQSAMWPYGYIGNLNFNPVNPDLTAQGKGFQRVAAEDAQISESVSTMGTGWFWGITNKSKNQAGAIAFLDYMYGDEGAFTFENGPEGVIWKVNADGQPEFTELGAGDWSAEVPAEFGGGKVADTFKFRVNGAFISPDAVNTKYDSPSNYNTWTTYLSDNASALDKLWSADHGDALNMKQVLVDQGRVFGFEAKNVPQMVRSDEDKVILSQVGDVIKQYSWRMIYANSDEEFDKLQQDMISQAKALGYDKLVEFETGYAKNYFDAS